MKPKANKNKAKDVEKNPKIQELKAEMADLFLQREPLITRREQDLVAIQQINNKLNQIADALRKAQ